MWVPVKNRDEENERIVRKILQYGAKHPEVSKYVMSLRYFKQSIGPITTILMLAVFIHLHQATRSEFNHQLGYWLTYPSEATFIANILIEAKIKRNLTQEKPHAINSVSDD